MNMFQPARVNVAFARATRFINHISRNKTDTCAALHLMARAHVPLAAEMYDKT